MRNRRSQGNRYLLWFPTAERASEVLNSLGVPGKDYFFGYDIRILDNGVDEIRLFPSGDDPRIVVADSPIRYTAAGDFLNSYERYARKRSSSWKSTSSSILSDLEFFRTVPELDGAILFFGSNDMGVDRMNFTLVSRTFVERLRAFVNEEWNAVSRRETEIDGGTDRK